MELNRRNFIKFLVGGAAGIGATPLPWKLTDDIAIWTQNWPWVPLPPVGEFTHVKSVCTLCPGGCGIKVRKAGERAVKIEGRTDYPVNPGGICPLGMGGLQLLYNEDIRFTSPMKRTGPRGSGTLVGITWDEALDLLSGRISSLRTDKRPEALAAVDGNPRSSTMAIMIERMLSSIGSRNYLRIPCAEDTYRMANSLMQGTDGPMAYDLENADYILSFGSGLLEGWGAPARVINAWSLWRGDSSRKKANVVQIESRASRTASKADKWVAPRPGTEAALAMGLAHVIIKEGLYNTGFVNNYSFGFNDWSSADGKHHRGFRTVVFESYSPSQVSEITGLNPKDIVCLARDFAKANAPVAICGKGKGALNGSLYEFMAVQSLNALVGNINTPGGVLVHDPLPLGSLQELELDTIAQQGLKKPRLDQAGSAKYPFTQSLINNFTDAIIDNHESPVDTLLIFSVNPAYTLPEGGRFKEALKKVPFIVSFSPFRDETSNMADLILPDHTYLEKKDDLVWPTGLQYPLYGLSQPVVNPLYDTRNTGDVIIQVSKRIAESVGSAFPWKTYEEVLALRAKGLFDSSGGLTHYDETTPVWKRMGGEGSVSPDYASFDEMWEKIEAGGLWYRPAHSYKNWKTLFKTPSGKFEFFSRQIEQALCNFIQQTSEKTGLEALGIDKKGDKVSMPHYERVKIEVDRVIYPLLMVPYEVINLSTGWVPNPPHLNKTLFDNQLRKDESFVEINPKTAAEYDLREAAPVLIKSPVGELRVRVSLFEGAMPGIVYLLFGLGHTAYDEFSRGKGINPNDIIYSGKDPLSGHPVWWNTPVRLIKV